MGIANHMRSILQLLTAAAVLAAGAVTPPKCAAGLQTTIQRWSLVGDDVAERSRFVAPSLYSSGAVQIDARLRPQLTYDARQGAVSLDLPARFVGLSVGARPNLNFWPSVWFDPADVSVSLTGVDLAESLPGFPRAKFWISGNKNYTVTEQETPPSQELLQRSSTGKLLWTLTKPQPPTTGWLYPDLLGGEIELGPVLPAGLSADEARSRITGEVRYRVARLDYPLTSVPLSIRVIPEPGGCLLVSLGFGVLLLRFLRPTIA